MPEPTSKPLTYEHYLHFPDDGKQHEIIEGQHYVTPAPKTTHQEILGALHFAFESARRQLASSGRSAGKVYLSPTDVVFSEINVVQPDLIYLTEKQCRVITEANLQGAPSLALEILSASTRRKDEVLKRDLYEKFEVLEYWIVDPVVASVKIYRREGELFDRGRLLEARHGESVTSPLLPGLEIDLGTLFAEVETS